MTSSFSPSHLILAAIALVIGLALGGLGPRSDARALRTRVAELEATCEPSNGARRTIAEFFDPRRWDAERPPTAPAPRPSPSEPEAIDAPVASAPSPEPSTRGANVPPSLGGDGPDPGRVAEMYEALDLRRAQARRALIEQANPTEGQLIEIDTIVEDMNADISNIALDFVDSVEASGGEPSRRQAMEFAREALDVMLVSEDALWSTLDAGQADSVDPEAIDPFSYIDGSVVESLMELDR